MLLSTKLHLILEQRAEGWIAGLSGVDLMVTPSGDWRAVARWYADIARLRGVENGYCVLRPVSRGYMLAADQYGRTVAYAHWWAMQQPSITAELPVERVATVYTRIGEAFAWLCVAGLATLTLTQALRQAVPAKRSTTSYSTRVPQRSERRLIRSSLPWMREPSPGPSSRPGAKP